MTTEAKRLILTRDYFGREKMLDYESGNPHRFPEGSTFGPLDGQPKRGIVGGGFRRQIFTVSDKDPKPGYPRILHTLGEFAPLDHPFASGKTLFDFLVQDSVTAAGVETHFTWPHRTTENRGETDQMRREFDGKLVHALRDVPFKVEMLGYQRRYLLYFGPGNAQTQTIYKTLAPLPIRESPFNADGKISARYRDNYPPEMVEKALAETGNLPIPEAWNAMPIRPLLYRGPAWCMRFLLDDQNPLEENRVWVTDEAEFICSDWCQRHNYTTYHRGIDYQAQEFDLSTWITVGLIKRAMRDRTFKPSSGEIKHHMVKDLLKELKEPNVVTKMVQDALMQRQFGFENPPVEFEGLQFDPWHLSFKAVTEKDGIVGNNIHGRLPGLAGVPKGTELTMYIGFGANIPHFISEQKDYRGKVTYAAESATPLFGPVMQSRLKGLCRAFNLGLAEGFGDEAFILDGLLQDSVDAYRRELGVLKTKPNLQYRMDKFSRLFKVEAVTVQEAALVLAGVDEGDVDHGQGRDGDDIDFDEGEERFGDDDDDNGGPF